MHRWPESFGVLGCSAVVPVKVRRPVGSTPNSGVNICDAGIHAASASVVVLGSTRWLLCASEPIGLIFREACAAFSIDEGLTFLGSVNALTVSASPKPMDRASVLAAAARGEAETLYHSAPSQVQTPSATSEAIPTTTALAASDDAYAYTCGTGFHVPATQAGTVWASVQAKAFSLTVVPSIVQLRGIDTGSLGCHGEERHVESQYVVAD